MYWWQLEIKGKTYGRGKCASGLECWPGFEQPFKRSAGSDSTYDYSFWVHRVKERSVYFPEFEEPGCGVFATLEFEFPDMGTPGKCYKATAGNCLGDADWINYPSTGCITGLFFQGPCTRSAAFQSKCDMYEEESCTCNGGFMSPIVIDLDHSGFSMTDAADGVVFNFLNDGVPLALAWTAVDSTNAFLVLDRDGNGFIDNGEELFGDVTPQPSSSTPNGFLALEQYDKPANGGNENGRIDHEDSIFSQLRLWQDFNHNCISESSELKFLSEMIRAIDLDYKESRRTDQYGNQFRYRAKVYDVRGIHAGRWAWDVFLTFQ